MAARPPTSSIGVPVLPGRITVDSLAPPAPPGAVRTVWLPLALLVAVYLNLGGLTYLVHQDTLDGTLRRLDEILFGVEPTLILERITTPWLSEVMTAAYAMHFFYPVGLLIVLFVAGMRAQFREVFLALRLCFFLGFLGYILVPAVGPRFAMPEMFSVPLSGWLTERGAAVWSAMQPIQRDGFPSLHAGISTVTLIYLWRFRDLWPGGRVAAWVCTPLIGLLWLSTVYLRYHWTVDVVAGWLLALLCIWFASNLVRSRRKFSRLTVNCS